MKVVFFTVSVLYSMMVSEKQEIRVKRTKSGN